MEFVSFMYSDQKVWLSEVLSSVCCQPATNVLLSLLPELRAQLLPLPPKVHVKSLTSLTHFQAGGFGERSLKFPDVVKTACSLTVRQEHTGHKKRIKFV